MRHQRPLTTAPSEDESSSTSSAAAATAANRWSERLPAHQGLSVQPGG